MSAASVFAAVLSVAVSIHDGDTLTVRDSDGSKVVLRLAQIDAPERTQPYWRISRAALIELCGVGHRVEFRPVDTDRYGRTVAQVECDGVDVNFELVRRGLAWCFRRYVTDERCYGIEAEARSAGRGLWRDPAPVTPWDFRAAQRAAKQE